MIVYPTDPKSVIFAKCYNESILYILDCYAKESHSDIILPATFDREDGPKHRSYHSALLRANLVVLDHMPYGYLVIKNRYTGRTGYLMSQVEFDEVTKDNVNREYYAKMEEIVQAKGW